VLQRQEILDQPPGQRVHSRVNGIHPY
jgi:hypothetical protein